MRFPDFKLFLFVGITSNFKPAETGCCTGDLDCNYLLYFCSVQTVHCLTIDPLVTLKQSVSFGQS